MVTTQTIQVPCTSPILPVPNPDSDSSDGLFSVPGHYTKNGVQVDYHSHVDAHSSGVASTSTAWNTYASMDNESFRLAMAAADIDDTAPSIAYRARQAQPFTMPPFDSITQLLGWATVISRDSAPTGANEYITYGGYLHTPKPAGLTSSFTQRTTDLLSDFAIIGTDIEWARTKYNDIAADAAAGTLEVTVARSGAYPWGIHDVAYLGLILEVTLLVEPSIDGLQGEVRRRFT